MPRSDHIETLRRARDKALERAARGELVAAHLIEAEMWERKLRCYAERKG